MIRSPLLACIALLLLVAAASGAAVTGPATITAPGTYELAADVSGAGANAAIEVLSSDVVIEGNGHAVAGTASGGELAGILIQGAPGAPVERVAIRNLTLRGWQYGVHAVGASGLELRNVTAVENDDHGIYLFSTANSTVRNCTADRNGGSGVVLSDVSDGNAVEGTSASRNEHNGLMLIASANNRVAGNTVRENGAYGIDGYLARGNVIADNLFVNANNTHIEEFDTNTWSLPASAGPNVAGGPQRGGNFWGRPDGTGFSEVTPDANGDGFCDAAYTIVRGNVDELPLKGTGATPLPTSAPGFGLSAALAALGALPLLRRLR